MIFFSVIRLDYLECFNAQQFYKAIIDEASAFGNKSIVSYNQEKNVICFVNKVWAPPKINMLLVMYLHI